MEVPKPLPWHLVETETTWNELIVPYLDGCIEIVMESLVRATTADERAICQGEMIALRNLRDAPNMMERIKARADKLEEERLKALEVVSNGGRRNTRRR
jgi:hypothetical protein